MSVKKENCLAKFVVFGGMRTKAMQLHDENILPSAESDFGFNNSITAAKSCLPCVAVMMRETSHDDDAMRLGNWKIILFSAPFYLSL